MPYLRPESTLELAGARPHGQVACYAARLGRAGSGDACRARRSDAAAHRSKAVARSGAEAVRRVPRRRPMWSVRANGAEARRAGSYVLEACYDAAPHTLPRRHPSDPKVGQPLVSAGERPQPVDLHQQDRGRLRPLPPAWGVGRDGGDELCTGGGLPRPTHRAPAGAPDRHFFASRTRLGEGVK